MAIDIPFRHDFAFEHLIGATEVAAIEPGPDRTEHVRVLLDPLYRPAHR
jgi:hypothetical protein